MKVLTMPQAAKTVNLRDRRFTVMGLARTGAAAARFLASRGAKVTVTDLRREDELAEVLARLPKEVERALGGHPEEIFESADGLVVSPGISRDHPMIFRALGAGVPVWSEVELAFRFCPVPVIAVTGTNGKTTTVQLVSALLEAGGFRAPGVGNIGSPFIGAIDEEPSADFMVVEVSSFQLEWVETFRPHVALLTNITADHLDRHPTLEDYLSWKRRIFARQEQTDLVVLNADDPLVLDLGRDARGQTLLFSRTQTVERGAFLQDENLFLSFGAEATHVCRRDELPLAGLHNLENVLAAIAVGGALEISPVVMGEAIRAFQPLPHRLQWVRERRGVRYFNDSKGTNVGAAQKSLESFDSPIVLIAGGRDKGSDLAPLRPLVQDRVKRLILIGEARDRFRSAFAGLTQYEEAKGLVEAVQMAAAAASPGDVVLLSPACASFDMFVDYEDRGNQFIRLVEALPA